MIPEKSTLFLPGVKVFRTKLDVELLAAMVHPAALSVNTAVVFCTNNGGLRGVALNISKRIFLAQQRNGLGVARGFSALHFWRSCPSEERLLQLSWSKGCQLLPVADDLGVPTASQPLFRVRLATARGSKSAQKKERCLNQE